MDQGLKERLIGAAVLVALGVWLIPWVLNGPEETHETQATSLELPAPDESLPVKSQTLDLRRDEVVEEAPAVEQSAASDVGPASIEASPPAAAIETAAAPKADASSVPVREVEATAAVHAAANEASTTKAPASAPTGKTAVAATPSKNASTSAPTTRTASTTSPPKPQPAAAAGGGWAVQLGSFGEEENARRLAARVKTYGYKADVSNVRAGGRSLYRVRIGPISARGEADAAASALTAHGFVARVVAAD
jgi:DedD protein